MTLVCPVQKEHGVKPCDVINLVQGKSVTELCMVCGKSQKKPEKPSPPKEEPHEADHSH